MKGDERIRTATTDSLYADRRIHVSSPGVEIVRYDRSGKWYIEIAANHGRTGLPAERIPVKLGEAALHARGLIARGATHHVGVPGGQAFDRLINRP